MKIHPPIAVLLRLFSFFVAAELSAQTPTPAAKAGEKNSPEQEAVQLDAYRVIGTAVGQAPSNTPLEATQPKSIIGTEFIQNKIPLTSDYSDIIRISPGVFANSPNGPVTSAPHLTIRGFADGDFNETVDGIPYSYYSGGHNNSFNLATHDIGAISVDRGPGTASTLGDATFGGTLAIESKNPSSTAMLDPYATVGSFNTSLLGLEVNPGPISGTTALIDLENVNTDGYLSHSPTSRKYGFFKSQTALGPQTILTLFALYDHEPISPDVTGATLAQIAKYGSNYGFNNDPTSQGYYKYYQSPTTASFNYVGFKTAPRDGLNLDNKLYYFELLRNNFDAADSSGNTPNGTAYGANDVPGGSKQTYNHAWGDVMKLSQSLPFGNLNFGVWLEKQTTHLFGYNFDMTLGAGAVNPPGARPAYDQYFTLITEQPYAEVVWRVTPDLTLTPGAKWSFYSPGTSAAINRGIGNVLVATEHFNKVVPEVVANYRPSARSAVYAEVAEGFEPPRFNTLQVQDPRLNSVSPETTVNYQLGGSWESDGLTLSADAYRISFDNAVASQTVAGIKTFFNQGGVTRKGVEAEGTVRLGGGFSLYGNGSLNRATNNLTGLDIPQAPRTTVAGGLLYDDGKWSGSLIDKWIGKRYGDVNLQQPIDAYNQLDFALGWRMPAKFGLSHPSLKLEITNLLDRRKINDFGGYGGNHVPLFFTQTSRAYFLTVDLPFGAPAK